MLRGLQRYDVARFALDKGTDVAAPKAQRTVSFMEILGLVIDPSDAGQMPAHVVGYRFDDMRLRKSSLVEMGHP